MENYLVEDYMRKQKQSELAKNSAVRNKRKRAIELFEQGLQDIDVLSEALETTPARIREFLGKSRLARIGIITEPETKTEEDFDDFDVSEDSTTDTVDAKQVPGISKKFTEKDAIKYSGERDQTIIMFHREGLTLEEVANKLNLTVGQAKERYIALGLPIYTRQELDDMRKEKDEEARKEKAKKGKKEPENKETETSATVNEELDAEGKPDAAGDKPIQENDQKEVEELKSFEEVKRAIYRLIKSRNSQKAMRLAKYYVRYADFLNDDEKKRLTGMADTIELLRAKESGKKSKER